MRDNGRHGLRLTFAPLPALAAAALATAVFVNGCAPASTGHAPERASAAPQAAHALPPAPERTPAPHERPHVQTSAPPAAPSLAPRNEQRAAVKPHQTMTRDNGAPSPSGGSPASLHVASPHAPPQIYGVSISPTVASAGEVVSGTVTTSSNVASVVATVAGISSGVPKVGVGEFAMSYRLPPAIPGFVKGSYTIVVVARNVDGASTSRAIGITLR